MDRKHLLIAISFLLAAALAVAAPSDSDLKAQAEGFISATGIKGGLVVHVGCGDGKLTAALRVNDSYIVHGIETDENAVTNARKHVESLGLYGKVTIGLWNGMELPYIDNLVNLLVVEDMKNSSMTELMRVLAPKGVAYIKKNGKWSKTVKAWPDDIDEWTHFLYDASGNAVAKDKVVGSPRRVQWQAGPKRARDHDSMASMSAMTSSNGRMFYIYDEGPTSLVYKPAQWSLTARDAFNGVTLWKRDIESWVTHLIYFRTGPVQLPRRLVSVGDRVYVTLGLDAPVTALDAATGETVLTYKGSQNTEEILYEDDVLLTVNGDPSLWNREAKGAFGYWELSVEKEPEVAKSITAYRAGTGEILWKKSGKNLEHLVPLSLSVNDGKAFYLDNEKVHCLDLKTGDESWSAPCPTNGLFLRSYAPTVVAYDDVLLCLTLKELVAFSAKDGKRLWQHKGYLGFGSPGDLFAINGLAWTIPMTGAIRSGVRLGDDGKIKDGIAIPKENFIGNNGSEIWGIDIHTGEVAKSFAKKDTLPGGHHHRCYRNKATEQYLICGRRGLEFVDLDGTDHVNNWWIRGECQYGIMPCNGLVYVPPDPCKCFNFIRVNGFNALSPTSSLDSLQTDDDGRLLSGPAYGKVKETSAKASEEWPTYRSDTSRSGCADTYVSAQLEEAWQTDLGGQLTAVVVAGNRLYTAQVDKHAVICLDAGSGKVLWRFTAGGQIDSPPTISKGLAVFGCRDGWVYCLRASDGALVWRFKAAPVDRKTVVDNNLESVWPVHGNVLVVDGVAYFAAGRSSYLDEGIRLYGLDLVTGEKLCATTVAAFPIRPGEKDTAQNSIGALPDVLVADGDFINMRQIQFDKELKLQSSAKIDALLASTGFLEDLWFHRQNWSLGNDKEIKSSAHAGALIAKSKSSPNQIGKLIVHDGKNSYAVQTPYTFLKHTASLFPASHDGHKHQKYSRYTPDQFPIGSGVVGRGLGIEQSGQNDNWEVQSPLQIRAMLMADQYLFMAGWPDSVTIGQDTRKEIQEATQLVVLSRRGGKKLAEYPLDAQPVFDGMAAAYGRLYVPLKNGRIVCMQSADSDKL